METKKCSKCATVKPVDSFRRDRSHVDGYRSSCVECESLLRRLNYYNCDGISTNFTSVNTKACECCSKVFYKNSQSRSKLCRVCSSQPKKCNRCNEVRDSDDFRREVHGRSVVLNTCKECRSNGDIERSCKPEDLLSRMKARAKLRAKKKGSSFEEECFLKIPDTCALSKLPFVYEHGTTHHRLFTPSPDRIDSSKGYTVDNVQFIHSWINTAKGEMPMEQFKELILQLADSFKE